MRLPLSLLCLASVALPASAMGQTRDADQDAEIQRLRQTVEQLTARIQALEGGKTTSTPSAAAVGVATAPSVVSAPAAVPATAAAVATPTVLNVTISPLPPRDPFDEDDQAGARMDNEVPPGDELEGFFALPGTSTWLRLSGYAKLDAMYDDGDAGDSDMFITSEIPVDGGRDSARFNMHARQTRFTIEARRDTGAGPLRFVLQNDFFGSGGSYGYRLRHAYGQLGNTYAGFGWSAFMDLDSGPDTLDFAGPGASPSARVASVRQYIPLRGGNQLIIAAEHRAPELQLDGATQQSRTAAPNLVLAARHEADWGSLQLAGVLRYLAFDSARDSGEGSDGTTAGGLAFSGTWGGSSGSYFVFGAVGGQGIAAYLGDLGGLNLDGVVDANNEIQTLQQYGGWIGYTHRWSQRWHSTVTWSRLYLERDALLDPAVFRRSDYAAANLIWQPAPSWSWGAEVLYGKLQEQSGASGDVFRVQTALKYDFIK
ncbi:DcaP family trimeric outer membrane transporter [Stenotrophomonas sp. PS02289]|uniref:DcaP family trimeric outer membrane transporter n=1 Tax=Stenotrophomonas sp. PS02289 TaxID=2991422 RepID=UPI002499CB88|nr:DcaP family trimeric outer membrane transporter [Stenotrophomonas sp. PS02289]